MYALKIPEYACKYALKIFEICNEICTKKAKICTKPSNNMLNMQNMHTKNSKFKFIFFGLIQSRSFALFSSALPILEWNYWNLIRRIAFKAGRPSSFTGNAILLWRTNSWKIRCLEGKISQNHLKYAKHAKYAKTCKICTYTWNMQNMESQTTIFGVPGPWNVKISRFRVDIYLWTEHASAYKSAL